MRVQFHPEVRLDRKRGHEFAQKLATFIDPQKIELTQEKWTFTQPLGSAANSFLSVTVTQRDLQMHASFPSFGKEWYEQRYQMLLKQFRAFFGPEMILESSAMVRGVLSVDGDARIFLSQHVMQIDPARTDSFGRPIHLVGIRFFFPPFMKPKEGKRKQGVVDWQVNVKAESLIEDPTKLFLEADADWPVPRSWNEDSEKEEIQRLEAVSQYLEKNVIAFLQHEGGDSEPPSPAESEGQPL